MPAARKHVVAPHMMMVALPPVTLVLGGCNLIDPRACTLEARPAITVEVIDSATAAHVGGARIVAADGAYADTVLTHTHFWGGYSLAYERAGTYTVTVEHADFQTWSRSGIRVSRNRCHVNTVHLTARLQP